MSCGKVCVYVCLNLQRILHVAVLVPEKYSAQGKFLTNSQEHCYTVHLFIYVIKQQTFGHNNISLLGVSVFTPCELTSNKLTTTKLTSLQSGDIFTDSSPTDISILGRHSILTTHKHHILCEWCETSDHTLSHVDSTIYGHRLRGGCYLVGELVLQVISPSIVHCRVPPELDGCVGHLEHL